MGLRPSGLCSSRESAGLSPGRCPPGVSRPTETTLAMRFAGPAISRFMTPRQRASGPPSGPCSSRESVPPCGWFRARTQADALLVFILPRAFPSKSSGLPSLPDPLACFVADLRSFESLPALHHSVLPDSVVACLSRDCLPFRDSSLGSRPPIWNVCRAGL